MKSFLRFSTGISIALITFSATSFAGPQEYAKGFLQGLSIGENVLDDYTSGYGDVDYHIATFNFRKWFADDFAKRLNQNLNLIQSGLIKLSLEEMSSDIQSAQQTGYGDVYYWSQSVRNQNSIFQRASERIVNLENTVVGGATTIAGDAEAGFLKGLEVSVDSLSSALDYTRYGDVDLHKRLFGLRRNYANGIADALESRLSRIENGLLKNMLSELVKDFRSAPQSGYGDVDYWIDMQRQQDRVYKRVSAKLDDLINELSCDIAWSNRT